MSGSVGCLARGKVNGGRFRRHGGFTVTEGKSLFVLICTHGEKGGGGFANKTRKGNVGLLQLVAPDV